MSAGFDQLLADRGITLRDFGLAFARLIAALAVDPHGYFEMKYAARIEKAHSAAEISEVVVQLLQWVTSSEVTDTERKRIDAKLSEQGLPCLADLCCHLSP
jgi:hypothetical protein